MIPTAVCSDCQDPWKPRHRCTSGADLAAERIARSLTQADVAEVLGCHKQAVWRIEHEATPSAEDRARYRAALKETK
jgi:transcriptional regulator with XRE-family HTH domain